MADNRREPWERWSQRQRLPGNVDSNRLFGDRRCSTGGRTLANNASHPDQYPGLGLAIAGLPDLAGRARATAADAAGLAHADRATGILSDGPVTVRDVELEPLLAWCVAVLIFPGWAFRATPNCLPSTGKAGISCTATTNFVLPTKISKTTPCKVECGRWHGRFARENILTRRANHRHISNIAQSDCGASG